MPKKPKQIITKQDPPFTVQVELCQGCNLHCDHCGLNSIQALGEKNYKFMTKRTIINLCEQLAFLADKGWNPRIELAMHGDPSLHPKMVKMVKILRTMLPKHHLMMTSNGVGFLKTPTETIDAVLEHLNILALDNYESVKIVPKIMKRYEGIHKMLHYPENKDANPHRRGPISKRMLVIVQDILIAVNGVHATLNNHAGGGAPSNQNAAGKKCAKPFREISIRWDGSVALCCNSWSGVYKCGNINIEPIDTIWNNDQFNAARKKLYHGQRDFGDCKGCDALSYRVGLLPDKMGKQHLEEPSKSDLRIIKKATVGDPYTLPVLREWMTKERYWEEG